METRLFIDTSWTIEAANLVTSSADDDLAWLAAAVALNGETIEDVRVDDDGTQHLTTAAGHALSSRENRSQVRSVKGGASLAGTQRNRIVDYRRQMHAPDQGRP